LLTEFQTEATTRNYARQLLDFWSHDFAEKAATINVPVLFLSGEYDRIASPESAKSFAQLLPQAHFMQLQGATHYCIYDSPALVAELIEEFCRQAR
jgi:pimeloyl-ACP methyl ester carboxylesterase